MIPDVKFKNYYLQFIYSAKTDIVKYKNELEEIVINKEELYNYLNNNKQLLIEAYNIKSESYEYNRGWFDGFNDAKEAVDDAFEQLKKA